MPAPVVKHLAADGATEQSQQTWGPFVSGDSEVDSDPIKFGVENVDGRVLGTTPFTGLFLEIVQSGTNDGYTFYFTADDPNGTLSKPWGLGTSGAPSISVGGSGGSWGTTGTYGIKITALNATGETIGSVEGTFTISGTGQKATYTWVQTPGATSYKIYRTDSPGTYGASTFRTTVSGGATDTFQDDGTATSSGTPPSANTTGGAGPEYGDAPDDGDFSADALTIALAAGGGLAIGQQWFYWARIKVPAATSEVGNTRTLNITPTEE
jgi:hypothetical protein